MVPLRLAQWLTCQHEVIGDVEYHVASHLIWQLPKELTQLAYTLYIAEIATEKEVKRHFTISMVKEFVSILAMLTEKYLLLRWRIDILHKGWKTTVVLMWLVLDVRCSFRATPIYILEIDYSLGSKIFVMNKVVFPLSCTPIRDRFTYSDT